MSDLECLFELGLKAFDFGMAPEGAAQPVQDIFRVDGGSRRGEGSLRVHG